MEALPFTSSIEAYRGQAASLFAALQQRERKSIRFAVNYNPRLQPLGEDVFTKYDFTLQDAEEAILNFYQFKNWQEAEQYTKAVQEDKNVYEFEQAVESIIAGDTKTLSSLLKKNPALVKARSLRSWHHSMLLHYVGSNGVEDFRQKAPPNAVEVLNILLDAGADINATAGMYGGGSTVFGLTATSIWPAKAGVLKPLLDTMLARGAAIGDERSVVACLANGRPEAADALVNYGAKLDLEGAAGVGRLDVVKNYFNKNGNLKDPALRQQIENGYIWACEFGQTGVVRFLLDAGIHPDMQVDGMGGLHWAVLGAHLDTVKLLIERGASLEIENKYGGTVLESTLWSVIHSDPVYRWPDNAADWPTIIETILKAGAVVRNGVISWLQHTDEIPAEKKQPIEILLKKYSTV